jgi:hypothetical protein
VQLEIKIGAKKQFSSFVKLLPYDYEVMGSNVENTLLQKCRERLRT